MASIAATSCTTVTPTCGTEIRELDGRSSPYDLLGVERAASFDDIRAAYREAAMRWHPDRHPPEHAGLATRNFQMIQGAFATVGDPARRAEYDRRNPETESLLHTRPCATDAPSSPAPSASTQPFAPRGAPYTVLRKVQHTAPKRRAGLQRIPREGANIEVQLEISAKDNRHGATKRVPYKRVVACSECDASGKRVVPCSRCGGDAQTPAGPCGGCLGMGTQLEACIPCCAKGLVEAHALVEIAIPIGTINSTITVSGAGHTGSHIDGDLRVHVKLTPAGYVVSGLDTYLQTHPRAGLVTMDTPVGPLSVDFTIMTTSTRTPGNHVRISGFGLYSEALGTRGDLVLVLVAPEPPQRQR